MNLTFIIKNQLFLYQHVEIMLKKNTYKNQAKSQPHCKTKITKYHLALYTPTPFSLFSNQNIFIS